MSTKHTKHLFPYSTRDADTQLVGCVSAFFVGGKSGAYLREANRIELASRNWMGGKAGFHASGDMWRGDGEVTFGEIKGTKKFKK